MSGSQYPFSRLTCNNSLKSLPSCAILRTPSATQASNSWILSLSATPDLLLPWLKTKNNQSDAFNHHFQQTRWPTTELQPNDQKCALRQQYGRSAGIYNKLLLAHHYQPRMLKPLELWSFQHFPSPSNKSVDFRQLPMAFMTELLPDTVFAATSATFGLGNGSPLVFPALLQMVLLFTWRIPICPRHESSEVPRGLLSQWFFNVQNISRFATSMETLKLPWWSKNVQQITNAFTSFDNRFVHAELFVKHPEVLRRDTQHSKSLAPGTFGQSSTKASICLDFRYSDFMVRYFCSSMFISISSRTTFFVLDNEPKPCSWPPWHGDHGWVSRSPRRSATAASTERSTGSFPIALHWFHGNWVKNPPQKEW